MAARKKRKPAKKKKSAAKEKPAAAAPVSAKTLFLQGVDLAQTGFLFDAIGSFRAAAEQTRSPYADDALFNVGHCYLRMQLFGDALRTFGAVIEQFPRSKIAQVGDAKEFGRTAAKAHLGRCHAHLALGDGDAALAEVDALAKFKDSYVLERGRRVTFRTLARRAVKSHG
jgi:tetratricopeptide (TPR) repeat protein